MNPKRVLFFMFLSGVLYGGNGEASAAGRDDSWPQWRGPLQTGLAVTAEPPTTWSETDNVKWKVKLPGSGWATPIVWGDRIFIQTAIPTGKRRENAAGGGEAAASEPPSPPPGPGGEAGGRPGRGPGRRGGGEKPTEFHEFATLCLDRGTGAVKWQQVAREEVPHEGYRQNEGTFASSSGVTDGERYYANFGSRGIYCYDLEGKRLWDRDLGDLRIAMGFGEGNSPALWGEALVVNWDNEDDSFITALNKRTGEPLWKQPRDERTSWSTPLVLEHGGKAQAIVSATGKIRSYEVSTGKLLWECGGLTRNVIPSPVASPGEVFCMSGFQGNSLLAIRLGGSGDLTGTDSVLWSHKKSTPYVPSPLLAGERLYFLSGNNGILTCFNTKKGQPLFEAERLEALSGVYASPIGAGGKVYIAGRNGVTVVLKQSDTLEVLATNRLEEKFEASPVAVGRELLLRGREYLYCLAEKR